MAPAEYYYRMRGILKKEMVRDYVPKILLSRIYYKPLQQYQWNIKKKLAKLFISLIPMIIYVKSIKVNRCK